MVESEKCPFCGGRAEVESGITGARIKCLNCGASTEYYEDIPMSFALGGMGNLNDFHVVSKGRYGVNEAFEALNRRV